MEKGGKGRGKMNVSSPIISRCEWSDFRMCSQIPFIIKPGNNDPLSFHQCSLPAPFDFSGRVLIHLDTLFRRERIHFSIFQVPYVPSGLFGPLRLTTTFASTAPWPLYFVLLVATGAVQFRWSDCQTGVHPFFALLHLYSSTWHLLPNH
jgi:hypothetical protein